MLYSETRHSGRDPLFDDAGGESRDLWGDPADGPGSLQAGERVTVGGRALVLLEAV